MVFVEGEMEVQASAGEARRLVPGVVLLLENTTGRGHRSWVVGEKTVTMFAVRR